MQRFRFTLRWLCLSAAFLHLTCAPSHHTGLPAGSPFSTVAEVPFDPTPQGIASGDVTHRSAIIWARTEGPALVQVEWWEASGPHTSSADQAPMQSTAKRTAVQTTTDQTDYTIKVTLADLRPKTLYHYRVWAAPIAAAGRFVESAQRSQTGRFRTAPLPTDHEDVRFIWSGDLGGQGRCRIGEDAYPIFNHARAVQPHFMLFLGDLVYSDESCVTPPNDPGSAFAATTLQEYRQKHRYQRGAKSLRRFLAAVPVWAMWDDHEVNNNFSGPFDPQMPAGRRALLEYWPIRPQPEDPTRLYRKVRYGADLEVFILDTRQYRSRNRDQDGPDKTMLGSEQLRWLIHEVTHSAATWKVIATTVPLSYPAKFRPTLPGNDGWARSRDGTGFERELSVIVETLVTQRVHNVVWLAGDVHYPQGVAYDPNNDGKPDFHEFIAGPLSAYTGRPLSPPPTFRPTTLFVDTGFYNFGVVTASRDAFRVEIVDDEGTLRYQHTLAAR